MHGGSVSGPDEQIAECGVGTAVALSSELLFPDKWLDTM